MRTILPLAGAILCTLAAQGAKAQIAEQGLYSFTGGADGSDPYSTLLAATSGPGGKVMGLYGTTAGGGTYGAGTVFVLTPQSHGLPWALKTLWEFTDGSDGAYPSSTLFPSTKFVSESTTLYGATYLGGNGYGTVNALTGNTLSTIWTFTLGADGGYPIFGPVADKAGALYEATLSGGASGCGTVIQLTPPAQGQSAWTETALYSFTGGADGCGANGLIIDKRGRLFGTTYYGGSQNAYCSAGGGCGSVFALLPPALGQTAWTEQTLWTFQGGLDGASPYVPLTEGANGVLYGTTAFGGGASCSLYSGCGTVFAVTPPAVKNGPWTEQVLAAFSPSGNSSVPTAPVIIDRNGALYGTTSGNYEANGTVFRVNPPSASQLGWSLETLFEFPGGRAGSTPGLGLTADKAGTLYGTTSYGGDSNNGIVFSLTGTGFVP